MKKLIIAIVLVVAITTSCKKTNTTVDATCATAVVKYGGDPAADGVGWYLLVNESTGTKMEYPENLAAEYEVEGLQVNICFVKSDKDFTCFCATPLPKMITLKSIKRS